MYRFSLWASGFALSAAGFLSGQPAPMLLASALAASVATNAITTAEQKKNYRRLLAPLETQINDMQAEAQQRVQAMEAKVQDSQILHQDLHQQIQNLRTGQRLITSKHQKIQHQQTVLFAQLQQQGQQLQQFSKQATVRPASQPNNKVVTLPVSAQPAQTTAHIVIDGNNFSKNTQELGLPIDWKGLKVALADLAQDCDTFILKYYTGVFERPTVQQQAKLDRLKALKYEVVPLPVTRQGRDQWKTLGDDLAIAVDLMESAGPQDQVILVTGDGDFLPLIDKLLARSVQVTVVGPQRQSSQRLQKLQQEGFTFLSLESLYADILEIQKLTAA